MGIVLVLLRLVLGWFYVGSCREFEEEWCESGGLSAVQEMLEGISGKTRNYTSFQ